MKFYKDMKAIVHSPNGDTDFFDIVVVRRHNVIIFINNLSRL